MIIYLDFDIITREDGTPIKSRISFLNKHYDKGDEIHLWVKDEKGFLHEYVQKLEKWGCKFSYLKLGKPVYDILIDRKSLNSEEFFLDKKR